MKADETDPRFGSCAYRVLPDGRDLTVYQRIFNTILVVGRPNSPCHDDQW